jgi:hypothetical protein
MGFACFFSVDCERKTQTKPHRQNTMIRENGSGAREYCASGGRELTMAAGSGAAAAARVGREEGFRAWRGAAAAEAL